MIHADTHPTNVKLWLAPDRSTAYVRTSDGLLQALGHVAVAVAVSADQAVAIAERERPDIVLMDIRLLGSRDGIDAAEEIRHRLGIGSIFVTANTDAQTRRRAEAVSPLGFLEKPLTEQRLRLGLSSVGSG